MVQRFQAFHTVLCGSTNGVQMQPWGWLTALTGPLAPLSERYWNAHVTLAASFTSWWGLSGDVGFESMLPGVGP